MVVNAIDAKMLQKMFLAGAKSIEGKKDYINELNVFPVPDGDTGTNMTMTIMAAAKEVAKIEEPTMLNLGKAISGGSLRGARGNSGVILSQLFRGFCKEIQEEEVITTVVLARAFQKAVNTAYKAVMKPKEGTILTVAKGGSDKAIELLQQEKDIVEYCREVLAYMKVVLDKTPDMLPVLKEAGVVDSGGQGLVTILSGAFRVLAGEEIEIDFEHSTGNGNVGKVEVEAGEANIKFGYCTEFIIMLEKEYSMNTEMEFKAYLEEIGDSIVVVSDEDIVKVHVHSNDPGLAIQKALTYGSLTSIKIDNMREEHREKVIKETEKKQQEKIKEKSRKEVGFISVSVGEGINAIFKDLGVDYLIEGGQTMNPSTEDMLNAIDQINAETIFILPNNSNIILAANQAADLVEEKNIIVVPTKTVPQGITAMINYMMDKSPEENKENMLREISRIQTGQVTYAVRDTTIDGFEIHNGDIMGIGDEGILSVGNSIEEVTVQLIEKLISEESELVSIYYGQDRTEEDAEALAERICEAYPELEVEVQHGGQPIYYYLLSAE